MNIEIANRLLQYRKKHNLSQEELASQIGVSRQAVSKWERAEASPDTDNLILLAKLYGVTLDELLQGQEEPQVKDEKTTEENNTYNETENVENFTCSDKVSFKNGIHFHAKNGDKVDISFKDGINVHDSKGTKVKVGFDGIHVEENGEQKVYTDENGHVCCNEECKKKKSIWYKFPYPVIAVIMFFGWGFSGAWCGFALSWVSFLTIPLYYTLVDAIVKRNASHFAYPVLVVIVFVVTGMLYGIWHPMWLVFLTIPFYYFICEFFKKIVENFKKG